MATTLPSISLPKDLIEEIDAAAAELNKSPEAVVRASVRRYLKQERDWRALQEHASELARAAGIRTEDDVEDFIDSMSD
jgi:metal-responsive CopG/Arc/MetJ family transcriptional regulator